MKLVTPVQMNKIDSYTINKLGIPGIILMENAAQKVAEEAVLQCAGEVAGRRILLLAGKGNNGGDAFAAARILDNAGAMVSVYVLARLNEISGDALVNLDSLKGTGIKLLELIDSSQMSNLMEELSTDVLVIDGIFGTGFRGKPEGVAKEVIEAVNSSERKVISIDIPSGVNGETGEVPGVCIKAAITVTFCLPKAGLLFYPGCEKAGRLVMADIGISEEAVSHIDINRYIIDKEMVSALIPKRYSESNKGDYGKVFIITGSTGMTGSGCLCAGAAMRSGAGLVYIGVPASLAGIYSIKLTEPIAIPLPDNGNGILSTDAIPKIFKNMEKMDAVAIGPGLYLDDATVEIVRKVIAEGKCPLVIDADGLNAVARDVSVLGNKKSAIILTPHPGEMARLTGLSTKEVQSNRPGTALDFAVKHDVIVVLKGSRTIVALPDGSLYVNVTGNPGMATGGAGDVLTGIIAALAGQGMKPQEAAIAGVYLHGLAGDAAAVGLGMHGMVAGDIIDKLPGVIKETLGTENPVGNIFFGRN